jgi:hypothetical protein
MKLMLLPGMHWCPYSLKPVMNYKAYEYVWYKAKEIILITSIY